jgi:hypothetical protein
VIKEESFDTIPQFEDDIEIEKKRKQMIYSAMTKGLTDSQTLRLSKELDADILSLMIKQAVKKMK